MNFLLANLLLMVLLVLLEYYFFRKINRSLKLLFSSYAALRAKTLKILFILYLNSYPIFAAAYMQYYNLKGEGRVRIPVTELMDYLMVYPFWIFILIMVQCILFYIFIDLIRIISKVLKVHSEKRMRFNAAAVLVVLLLFSVYVPLRIYYDANFIHVTEMSYSSKNVPADLKGFRIAFISDLQADRYTDEELLRSYVEKVNSTQPDIVLIAGDLITSTPEYINTAAKWTGRIHSRYGVYSCVGDHDNWAYRTDNARSIREISAALLSNKVQMISNGNITIRNGSADITITFITNTYVGTISDAELDSLSRDSDSSDLRIFLTHQPGEHLVTSAAEKKYDLMLAGHTHGGQVTFLFPFISLTPTLFETSYVKGEFRIDDMVLVVCRGLGVSILPVRYNSTPEVISITLK